MIKSFWSDDATAKCALCGEDDTRERRILHCPVLHSIRQEHLEAVDILTNHQPSWVYIPLITQHPLTASLRFILQNCEPPPAMPAKAMRDPGDLITFFTDGGAIFPKDADARIASYAVVQATSSFSGTFAQTHAFAFNQPPILSNFEVVTSGIVPGNQTVARGELFAFYRAL